MSPSPEYVLGKTSVEVRHKQINFVLYLQTSEILAAIICFWKLAKFKFPTSQTSQVLIGLHEKLQWERQQYLVQAPGHQINHQFSGEIFSSCTYQIRSSSFQHLEGTIPAATAATGHKNPGHFKCGYLGNESYRRSTGDKNDQCFEGFSDFLASVVLLFCQKS